jgi:phenylacetate-CoA ligase
MRDVLFDLASKNRFFDSWEEVGSDERNFLVRKKLDDYVKLSRELPFYQKRLQSYDPKSEHPLSQVQVLLPDELKSALPPFGSDLVRQNAGAYSVFQSGGTTGFPKTALFSSDEMDGLDLANARGYYACGLLPSDRVGNLFAAGSLYMTFIHINAMLQRYGCTSLAFSHVVDPSFFKMVAEKFQVNTLAGVSSIILNVLRETARTETSLTLEKIYYGGEHMYDSDKIMLKEKFGTKQILSPGYGTVDTCYIGYQCTHTPTGVFHAFDDLCYIEIVNEETGRPTAIEETGMIYATAFVRKLTPIMRYRVGDLARWIKAPCSCGRKTPLFELF